MTSSRRNLPVGRSNRAMAQLKVKQQGTTMSFYLNGHAVQLSTDDSTLGATSVRRFGLYIDNAP